MSVMKAKTELFSLAFFDLQLHFAQKVAELSGISLAQAVGSHTNIYVRLGMGQQLDLKNPDWQTYLAGLTTAPLKSAWTYRCHANRQGIPAGPTLTCAAGCFSYALMGENLARLHFHAGEHLSASPLSLEHSPLRLSELRTLFSTLKASSSPSMHIVGASWLYHLPTYRRLFPPRYLAQLEPIAHPYQRMPLWGQFLTRDRQVRPDMAARFREDVAQATSLSALERCFPFPVLATTSPAQWFYEFLGI